MFWPTLAALAASVVLSGCRSVAVDFQNVTPGSPRRIPASEYRPRGAGPFPAVVLLHGCHGVSSSTHEWGRWFRDQGYVALVVDSWAPRGIGDGCVMAVDLPSTERFDDLMGAVRFLHERSYVDRDRIGTIGWSNGGVFSMSAINGPSLERARRRGVGFPPPGVRAAVGVYPGGCPSLVTEQVVRPLLILIGDADDWTDPAACARMAEAMRTRAADVTLVAYPGAVHYFDVPGTPRHVIANVANENRPGGCCGATVGYDPVAHADARRRVAEFFGVHLGR